MDYTFDYRTERDACGIGFVADAGGAARRDIVEAAVGALCRGEHRGAVAAGALTGDGAGILTPIPEKVFGKRAVAMIFARSDGFEKIVEAAARAEGFTALEWREVPTDVNALGTQAK